MVQMNAQEQIGNFRSAIGNAQFQRIKALYRGNITLEA